MMSTDKDKLQELLEARAIADQELEKMRTPVTILFSDIKGSTPYFEKKGDLAGMAMINRHNGILFPVIEGEVFGDVVNAASRVQHQAQTEQILITDALLDAAKSAGFECARMGRAELKGKDEPIDLYAVAWSASATQQLVEEVQAQYEKKFKELKRQQDELEEEFENARDQWRVERRNLNAEIEQLEEAAERARLSARAQISDEMQSEIRFQLEEAMRARQQ